LYLAFSIAAIGCRNRAQCRGQYRGQQQEKSHRNPGTQRHIGLLERRHGRRRRAIHADRQNQPPECDAAHKLSRQRA
jgi:hypothetical protein